MLADGGDNYHALRDKHLFYILFFRPISVHVSGGSTFSASVVGLVPGMFPIFSNTPPVVLILLDPNRPHKHILWHCSQII